MNNYTFTNLNRDHLRMIFLCAAVFAISFFPVPTAHASIVLSEISNYSTATRIDTNNIFTATATATGYPTQLRIPVINRVADCGTAERVYGLVGSSDSESILSTNYYTPETLTYGADNPLIFDFPQNNAFVFAGHSLIYRFVTADSQDSYYHGTLCFNTFAQYNNSLIDTNHTILGELVPTAPAIPSIRPGSLRQLKSDGVTQINEAGLIGESTVVFSAILDSAASGANDLRIQVEYTTTGSFTGVPNITSAPVSAGTIATATASSLQDGSYRWHARAWDATSNLASSWQEFGVQGNTDFVIKTVATFPDVYADNITVFSAINAQSGGAFGASELSPGPVSYDLPSQFAITGIMVDIDDFSGNNHNGMGNVRAWIFDASDAPIASSSNTFYGEGTGHNTLYNFNGQLIPKNFKLRLIAEDGLQGGANFTFRNIRFLGVGITVPDHASLAQNQTADISSISEGSLVRSGSITFGVDTPSWDENLALQVELRQIYEPFNDLDDGGLITSAFLTAPGHATMSRPGLFDGAYHWRARFVAVSGKYSLWQEFGTAGNIDFVIDTSGTSFGGPAFPLYAVGSSEWHDISNISAHDGASAYMYTDFGRGGTADLVVQLASDGQRVGQNKGLDSYFGYFSDVERVYGSPTDDWGLGADLTPDFLNNGNFSLTIQLRRGGSDYPASPIYATGFRFDIPQNVQIQGIEARVHYRVDPITSPFMADKTQIEFVELTVYYENPLTPVIIVPGLLGTRLNKVGGEEVWPNPSKMIDSENTDDAYLNDLALDSNGNKITNISEGDLFRKFTVSILGLPVKNQVVYQDLVNSLENAGYQENQELFILKYDWRMSVEDLTAVLGAKIQEALSHSTTGRVNIVAHSMGSILTKEYLLQNPSASASIDNLIFVGSPNLGAPKAFKVLEYGDNFGFKDGNEEVLNHLEMKSISQNMPSAYQFLPGREYFSRERSGSYLFDYRQVGTPTLNYDQVKSYLSQNPIHNQAMLNANDSFHQGFDLAPLPLSPTTHFYNIVGCQNTDTIGRFRLYPNEKYEIDLVDGDGTVPRISANSYSQGQTYYILSSETDADHMGLVQKVEPLGLITGILRSQPGLDLIDGVSRSVSDCNFTVRRSVLSSHSPVYLHVYDEFGNHTGATSPGGIEIGIPDSDHEMIGDNTFIFIPASGTYRIVMDAYASGTADLEMQTYENFASEKKTTFLNVPLTSSQTNTEVLFNEASTTAPVLSLDSNGDNIIDQLIYPTAQLSSLASADVTPPILTMPSIASSYILGNATSLLFSATDAENRVALFKATLNGIGIQSGQVIALDHLGNNIFRLEAKDSAGNPNVQELHFNVVYQFGGFESPIKPDGSGIYKQGRVLPVKFKLTDTAGVPIANASATLAITKTRDGIAGTGEIALSASQADTGNQFRYDANSSSYIFNLSTDLMSAGTWQLKVALDDGTNHAVDISIKE